MSCSRDAKPQDGPIHCGSTSHAEDPNEKVQPGLFRGRPMRGQDPEWKEMSCSRDAKPPRPGQYTRCWQGAWSPWPHRFLDLAVHGVLRHNAPENLAKLG